jgi:hypothetical protein
VFEIRTIALEICAPKHDGCAGPSQSCSGGQIFGREQLILAGGAASAAVQQPLVAAAISAPK